MPNDFAGDLWKEKVGGILTRCTRKRGGASSLPHRGWISASMSTRETVLRPELAPLGDFIDAIENKRTTRSTAARKLLLSAVAAGNSRNDYNRFGRRRIISVIRALQRKVSSYAQGKTNRGVRA